MENKKTLRNITIFLLGIFVGIVIYIIYFQAFVFEKQNIAEDRIETPIENEIPIERDACTQRLLQLLDFGNGEPDPNEVIELLNRGVDLNATNSDGWTALNLAVRARYYEIVKILLKPIPSAYQSAQVNVKDQVGMTLLLWAAILKNAAIVELLLENGAEMDIRDTQTESTVLHWAAAGGDVKVIKLLLEKGAQIDVQNNKGCTALHWAVRTMFEYMGVGVEKYEKVVEMLINAGANVNVPENNGNTPLHNAMKNENDMNAIVKILLNHGANVDMQNRKGNTPLHCAIQEGKVNDVKILLKHGANVNIQNNNDETPLLLAKQLSGVKKVIVKKLLKHLKQ